MTHLFRWGGLLLIALLLLQACQLSSEEEGSDDEEMNVTRMLSHVGTKASCIFFTTDQKNDPLVSWVEIDKDTTKHFFFAKYQKQDNVFSQPLEIPIEQNAAVHEEGMPKIAVKGDGTYFATYEVSIPQEGSRFGLQEIRYVISTDRGKTWSEPHSVTDDLEEKGLSGGFSNLARLPDGEIGIAWLGTDLQRVNGGRPILFAKSNSDNEFDPEIMVDKRACECCRTAIAAGENGKVTIMFRDLTTNSVRDISMVTSDDNGSSFGPTIPFSDDDWLVDGCPHAGPSVISKNGKDYVAWYTGSNKDEGVNYAVLSNKGQVLGRQNINSNSRYAQIDALEDGTVFVAYEEDVLRNDSAFSQIKIRKEGKDGAFEKKLTSGKTEVSFPVIHALDNGKVIVGWSENGMTHYKVVEMDKIDQPVMESTSSYLNKMVQQ